MMRTWTLPVLAASAALAVACGGADVKVKGKAGRGAAEGDLGRFGEASRCEVGEGMRESLVDLNQDDVADVRKVYAKGPDGEWILCREADLDFDGLKDIFVFFEESGYPKTDEVDLDYDGTIDIVTTYVDGKVVKQEIDTNSDAVIDRVRFMDNGLPSRLEGDTDGDGKVDYWEYYDAGRLIRVGMDTDGDGRADNWNRDEEGPEAEAEAEEEEEEEGEEGGEEAGEAAEETDNQEEVEDDPYGDE